MCEQFPCEDDEVCLRMGGVTCLSRRGCAARRLRRCVDLEALVCRSGDDDEDGSGDDGSGEESSNSESDESSSSRDENDGEPKIYQS